MLKINTKEYRPIEFEIDGVIHKTKKIVNRIQREVLKINKKMQAAENGSIEQYDCMIDMLILYTELDRDFIIDNLDLDDMSDIITEITAGISNPAGDEEGDKKEEFPLDGGNSGEEPPK